MSQTNPPPPPKPLAAPVTANRLHSHADVILTKIFEGYNLDGKEFPRLRVASMFVDQTPGGDMSRGLAAKHNFRIFDSIEGAVTLGRKEVAVDGVLIIGEHGKYPTNARGQILYPRRRFFEEVCRVFEASKKSVPVFSDKHLAAEWKDAKWMYDRAREVFFARFFCVLVV